VLGIAAAMIVAGSFGSVYLFEVGLELPATAIVFPLALLAGGVGLMVQAARDHWRVPAHAAVPVATLLVAYVVIVAVGYPVLGRTRPTALVARQLARTTSETAPVGLYRLERWRGSLRYYLERPITRLETPEEVRAFLAQPTQAYVVLRRLEFNTLREASVPIHLVRRYPAVVGTTGRGIRRQVWGFLYVATNKPPAPRSRSHSRPEGY
jgi:hypothetical protein